MPRTPSTWHSVVQIPSDELEQDDIPPGTADWGQINEFALTFDGYERWGSFDTCAEIANEIAERYRADGLPATDLDSIRTCLFFEQRRWRHFAEDPDDETMRYLHKLLAHMREIIGRRDTSEFLQNQPDEEGAS